MEVRSAAEFVYRELELRRGVAKVTANGAISAVLVRDFGQGGGDPGEKVFHIDAKRHWRNNRSQLLGSKRRFRVTMLRDNLVGLIVPMLSSAGANPLALCTARKKPSDDRPPCLENPRPEGAESTLTENAASPFHAEPIHLEHGLQVPTRNARGETFWKRPVYRSMHRMLTSPIYGGAYTYGKTEQLVRYDGGKPRYHCRRKPREQWLAL